MRGSVASVEGERVSYALVRLEPGFSDRFADEAGGFFFAGVPAGSYRLLVRQVGYQPFDSAITVVPGMAPVAVRLRHIAVTLSPLVVATTTRCENPGNPAQSGNPELIAIFEQLRQNAERARLLADNYPFRYTIERTTVAHIARGGQRTTVDTMHLDGRARWTYAPGRVVTPDHDSPGQYLVHLPVLADLADSAFHAAHCFVLGGADQFEADSGLIRLDFSASRRLTAPDVNGSAWLDPVTWQIRHTLVVLTHPELAVNSVRDWRATTSFTQIRPSILVQGAVRAVTSYTERTWRNNPLADTRRIEVQKLLGVHFLTPLPAVHP